MISVVVSLDRLVFAKRFLAEESVVLYQPTI